MAKSYRNGKGRFVPADNPVAVIGRLRDRRERERKAAEAQASRDLIARAQVMRRNGIYVSR